MHIPGIPCHPIPCFNPILSSYCICTYFRVYQISRMISAFRTDSRVPIFTYFEREYSAESAEKKNFKISLLEPEIEDFKVCRMIQMSMKVLCVTTCSYYIYNYFMHTHAQIFKFIE